MARSFRRLILAIVFGLVLVGGFLAWLWQPERQVRLHSEHFLRQIERQNWRGFDNFLADDFHDQWGDDRARVVTRSREVLGYFLTLQLTTTDPRVRLAGQEASWSAMIRLDGTGEGDAVAFVKDRVNTLATPFVLHWQRMSGKPWDWQLVGVENSSLELPATDL